jgi:DHA1 family tetracycline resistance protein-like MFS transporter
MVGFTMAVVGLCSMMVQGTLIGPIVKGLGERATLILGLCFGILGFAVFGLAPTGALFWAGIPILALWGLASPASLGLMSRRVGPSEQGRLQGANASLMGVANMLGPGLFTQTFALSIGGAAAWHLPGAGFLLASALIAVAALVAWRATV